MVIGIIEDDTLLRKALDTSMQNKGYTTILAGSRKEAIKNIDRSVDLLIVDIGLPDGDGINLYQELQKNGRIPAIFLTAKDDEKDMLKAFDIGADDYVVKPFSIKVLLKRMEVVLKRKSNENVFMCGQVILYSDRKQVFVGKTEISLTLKEYQLLEYFIITQDYFKKEYKEELNTDICEGCVEIVKTVLEDGDINTLNKYFLNNNAEEFVSSNPDLNGTNRVGLKEEYDIEFKQILDSSINQIKYIDKNQLKLSVVVSYQCNMSYKNKDAIVLGGSRDSVRGDHMTLDLYCTKDGDVWKISSWD